MSNNQLYRYTTGKNKRQIIEEYIVEYLKAHKCEHCPEQDFRVLTFDHLNPKTKSFNIAAVSSNPGHFTLIRLAHEISKCQILCANCHMRRTQEQRNSYRLKYV